MKQYLPDFKISLRPNNQITVTRQRLSRKKEPFFLPMQNDNHSHESLSKIIERYHARNGDDSYYDKASRKVITLASGNPTWNTPKALDNPRLLDITNRFQHSKVAAKICDRPLKRGYGAPPKIKNFTARSGQKLRECGSVIDILSDNCPNKSRVITLTLPASGEKAYTALSNYSAEIINRLLQIIRRQKDDKFHWFYCVEHQKRGALHWHICLYHEDKKESFRVGGELVSKWRDILSDIGVKCGVDLLFSKGFGRAVTSSEMQSINQEMQKGCGAYFSKYAAKTSVHKADRSAETINTRNARLYPPSSFWGRSRNLAKLCHQNSFLFRFNGMEDYESESLRADCLDSLSQFDLVFSHSFKFKKEISAYGGSLTICEGESEIFYISPSDYQKFLSFCRQRFDGSESSMISERSRRGGYLSRYESDIAYF